MGRSASKPAAALLDDQAIGLEARSHHDDHLSLRLWLRLLACRSEIEKEIRARLRAHCGMTLARFDYLAQLHRHPGGLRLVGTDADGEPVFGERVLRRPVEESLPGRLVQAVVRAPEEEPVTVTGQPLELLLRYQDRYRTVPVHCPGGLQYPHLEPLPGATDHLGDIIAAK